MQQSGQQGTGVERARMQRVAEALGDEVDLSAQSRDALDRIGAAIVGGARARTAQALSALVMPAQVRAVMEQLPSSWWWSKERLRYIVTGFEPFGAFEFNPSATVSELIAQTLTDAGASVRHEILPVTFSMAKEYAASTELEESEQLFFIHCGLSGSASSVRLEQFAHNAHGSTPDNDGRLARQALTPLRRLDPEGPEAVRTYLELPDMVGQAREMVDTALSRDAGDYVCNAIYYHSLRYVEQLRFGGGAGEALFVHVPNVDEAVARDIGRALGALFLRRYGALT